MGISFENRVAIVTGAGNGLGRSHALALARRGAKVVVNDLGTDRDGRGSAFPAAARVVEEIRAGVGTALANTGDVTKPEDMQALVESCLSEWGRIDILVNNAGILRDRSFGKLGLEDFRAVLDVHLMGSAILTQTVLPAMKSQDYGRIVFTTSGSGLFGNFGQSSYAAAKMACIGLMNVLHLELAKYDIRINALSPSALTRMTADLGIPDKAAELMTPEAVSAGLLYLVSPEAPRRTILCAGAGVYSLAAVLDSDGVFLPEAERSPERIAEIFQNLPAPAEMKPVPNAGDQGGRFLQKAAAAQNIKFT